MQKSEACESGLVLLLFSFSKCSNLFDSTGGTEIGPFESVQLCCQIAIFLSFGSHLPVTGLSIKARLAPHPATITKIFTYAHLH
jgi:hypothetical protein